MVYVFIYTYYIQIYNIGITCYNGKFERQIINRCTVSFTKHVHHKFILVYAFIQILIFLNLFLRNALYFLHIKIKY